MVVVVAAEVAELLWQRLRNDIVEPVQELVADDACEGERDLGKDLEASPTGPTQASARSPGASANSGVAKRCSGPDVGRRLLRPAPMILHQVR